MELNKIYCGNNLDILKTFPDESIDCCITSPPYYGLRDYGTGKWVGGDPNCPHRRLSKASDKTTTGHAQEELKGNVGDAIYKKVCPLCGAVREDLQVGLEETPEEYINRLVDIFREVKRVLKEEGTLWVNIGDSYAGGAGRWGGADGMSDKQSTNNGSLGQINKPTLWRHDIIKPKDLIGIPWMLAFALRVDGWYLRQDIIWHKPNPMPESVKDRCTKAHEYIFLLSKSKKYFFDSDAIHEIATGYDGRKDTLLKGSDKYSSDEYLPNGHANTFASKGHERWRFKNLAYKGFEGKVNTIHLKRAEGEEKQYPIRNKRDVWTISTKPFKGAHFATFPEELVRNCLLAGCPMGGTVLDPFMGSGTVGLVAKTNYRNYVGIDLNAEYVEIANNRIDGMVTDFREEKVDNQIVYQNLFG